MSATDWFLTGWVFGFLLGFAVMLNIAIWLERRKP